LYRDLVAQDEPCTIRSTNTRDIHTNFVSADASCDLESFIITIAKAKVGDKFWCRDGAQMPALLRQDPNSAGPDSQTFPLVSTFIPSVMPLAGSELKSINIRLSRSVSSNCTPKRRTYFFWLPIAYRFFSSGENAGLFSVGMRLIAKVTLAVLPHKHSREIQFLFGVLIPATRPAQIIGKINRSILLHDEVVRSAKPFTLGAIREDGALAVLFNTVDRAAAPCGNQQSVLAVESKAIRSDHEKNAFSIVRLRYTHAPDVIPRVTAVIKV
jgi:hypothetical protein